MSGNKTGIESVSNQPAVSQSLIDREPYFEPMSLKESNVFCFDDRKGFYIGIPGGLADIAMILAMLQEVHNPGSTQGNFADHIASNAQLLNESGLTNIGIHSDTAAEEGHTFNFDSSNPAIGCAFIAKQEGIQTLIAESHQSLLEEAKELEPRLWQSRSDFNQFGSKLARAGGRLIANGFFEVPSRDIARSAHQAEAPYDVVDGQHDQKSIGIINLVKDTTFNAPEAAAHNLPAYNSDAWATREIFAKLQRLIPHDANEAALADLMLTLATLKALRVGEIVVRTQTLAV